MNMSEAYRDKTFAVIDKISEALETGMITRDEALALLGIALRQEASDLVQQELSHFQNKNRKHYKRAIFLNYTNEMTTYV